MEHLGEQMERSQNAVFARNSETRRSVSGNDLKELERIARDRKVCFGAFSFRCLNVFHAC